jgi:hypothetical protein
MKQPSNPYACSPSMPALKRMFESRLFPGTLKRSFPRINAGGNVTLVE